MIGVIIHQPNKPEDGIVPVAVGNVKTTSRGMTVTVVRNAKPVKGKDGALVANTENLFFTNTKLMSSSDRNYSTLRHGLMNRIGCLLNNTHSFSYYDANHFRVVTFDTVEAAQKYLATHDVIVNFQRRSAVADKTDPEVLLEPGTVCTMAYLLQAAAQQQGGAEGAIGDVKVRVGNPRPTETETLTDKELTKAFTAIMENIAVAAATVQLAKMITSISSRTEDLFRNVGINTPIPVIELRVGAGKK